MKRSYFSTIVLALVLAFLYVPIILVVFYGFVPNGTTMSFYNSNGEFIGFTGKWYSMIFSGDRRVEALIESFWLSLTIAGLATVVSCVLGTTAALALHKWKGKLQSLHHALVYTPLIQQALDDRARTRSTAGVKEHLSLPQWCLYYFFTLLHGYSRKFTQR